MEVRTDSQLVAITKRRNTELKSVRDLDPGFSCQGQVGMFIGLYLQSEVFARKLQSYYRTDTGKNDDGKLNISVLKAAVRHFKLSFKEEFIDQVFTGGTGTRGGKSARQLRNGYLHSLSTEDKNEITQNEKRLSVRLSEFLSIEI
jgi:hypothetical protein